MKMFMIGMMSDMMPYMKPILYVATGFVLIGLLVILFNMGSLISGRNGSDIENAEERGKIGIIGKSVMWFGLFFVACEIAGYFLGAAPSFALFANPKEFDFGYQVTFWQMGLALFVVGIVYWLLSRRSSSTETA